MKALVSRGLIKPVHYCSLGDFVYTVNFKVRPESVSQLQPSALNVGCLEALGQAPGFSSSLKPTPVFVRVMDYLRWSCPVFWTVNAVHWKTSAHADTKTNPCCFMERQVWVFWCCTGISGTVNVIAVWAISRTSGSWQLSVHTTHCQLITKQDLRFKI